jgi:hypothetical protein
MSHLNPLTSALFRPKQPQLEKSLLSYCREPKSKKLLERMNIYQHDFFNWSMDITNETAHFYLNRETYMSELEQALQQEYEEEIAFRSLLENVIQEKIEKQISSQQGQLDALIRENKEMKAHIAKQNEEQKIMKAQLEALVNEKRKS